MSPKTGPKSARRPTPDRGERLPKSAIRGPDDGSSYPVFSYRYADRTYAGSWSWLRGEEHAEVTDFLCEMSRLTWHEIGNQLCGGQRRRRKHHEQPFTSVCPEAWARIKELKHHETFEELYRFRLGGKARLWGFRLGSTFFILWWDRDHEVLPTEPN